MEVATPSELTPAITSVADTVGNLMELMLGGGGGDSGNSTGNDTSAIDDPCAAVSIVDKVTFKTYLMYLLSYSYS